MHKLSSAHMLKFYDWYETRNNLWLILEYCTGADLESLVTPLYVCMYVCMYV